MYPVEDPSISVGRRASEQGKEWLNKGQANSHETYKYFLCIVFEIQEWDKITMK